MKKAENGLQHGKIYYSLSLIVLVLLIAAYATVQYPAGQAFATQSNDEGLSITTDPGSGFIRATNMAPGDQVSSPLTVHNNGTKRFAYYVSAVPGLDRELYDVLQLAVRDGSNNLVYEGRLKDLQNLALGTLSPSQQAGIGFTVSFPLESGNEYQDLNSVATFVFRTQEIPYATVTKTLAPVTTTRLAGDDRNKTAIAVAQSGWPLGADTVLLVRNDDYPDALAGIPLAFKYNAPILLTDKDVLSADTAGEIKRLNPGQLIILGSTGAVSADVEQAIVDQGINVSRLGGDDRFETAAAIARALGTGGRAVLANGYGFADALAISSWAANQGIPILLTGTYALPAATEQSLVELGIRETVVVGGPGVISDGLLGQLPKPTRYAGASRYETALEIVKQLQPNLNTLFLVTGETFPDALTGSVLAARTNSPLILVSRFEVADAVREFLEAEANKINSLIVLGGDGAVAESNVNEILTWLR